MGVLQGPNMSVVDSGQADVEDGGANAEEKLEDGELEVLQQVTFQVTHEDSESHLEASMWDVPLLIGHHPMGEPAVIVLMLGLLLLNIFGQCVFTYIVVNNLAVDNWSMDTVEDYRKWRSMIAHDIAFYNDMVGQSLAARVCSGDGSLEVATGQADAFAELSDFVGIGAGPGPGPVMCVLSMFTFLLMVLREYNAIAGLTDMFNATAQCKTVVTFIPTVKYVKLLFLPKQSLL